MDLLRKVQGEVHEVDAAVLRGWLARMPWNRTGAPPAACPLERP